MLVVRLSVRPSGADVQGDERGVHAHALSGDQAFAVPPRPDHRRPQRDLPQHVLHPEGGGRGKGTAQVVVAVVLGVEICRAIVKLSSE